MWILLVVGGVASLLFALLMVFERNAKEFLLAMIFGSLFLYVGWSMSTQKSPMQQEAEASLRETKARTNAIQAAVRRRDELRPHTAELEALAEQVLKAVEHRARNTPSLSRHLISSQSAIQHFQFPDQDGMIFIKVLDITTELEGQVVLLCRFNHGNGWLVEGVRARDFRNARGGAHYNESSLAEIGEMYELAVKMAVRDR